MFSKFLTSALCHLLLPVSPTWLVMNLLWEPLELLDLMAHQAQRVPKDVLALLVSLVSLVLDSLDQLDLKEMMVHLDNLVLMDSLVPPDPLDLVASQEMMDYLVLKDLLAHKDSQVHLVLLDLKDQAEAQDHREA